MTIGPDPPSVPGYRLGAYLGRGAMGTLWEAHDRTGRRVALKVADRPTRVGPEGMRRHHRREAAAALHVAHPNLVRALAVGTTEAGCPYVALEYLEGETLGHRIRRVGPLPEDEAVRAGLAMASALEHLHANGLVHRDVKPDNVMWLEDGNIKLLDLGLVDESGLESPGCGSPGYASPEMMKKQRVGPASDLWALGVTLATAALGRLPFQGETVQDVLRSAYRDPVVLPPSIAGRPLSEGFRRVVGRLLEKAPRDRYGSAAEARLDLEATRDGDKPFGAIWGQGVRRARGWTLPVAGALAAAALLALWVRSDSHVGLPTPSAPAEADDPEVEAALAAAARPGVAPTDARALLLRAVDRPMSAALRARYEAALSALAAPGDRRGEEELRERARMALRRRAAGDLEGTRALLEDWPDELSGTHAAAEGKRLARLWIAEARGPFDALLDEVERAATDASPLSAATLESVLGRLRAAREDPAAPLALRPSLAAAEARLEALGARLSVEGRETAAWMSLARLWGANENGREARLRGFLTQEGMAETRAGAALAGLLAKTDAADGVLRVHLERAAGRPTALWLRGRFRVGVLPHDEQPSAVFAPGYRIWDAAAPGSSALDTLVAEVGDEGVAAAWVLLHDLPGRKRLASAGSTLTDLLAHLPEAPRPPDVAKPPDDPTWRLLWELWPLAARPWRAPAPATTEPRGPVAAAWLAALARPGDPRTAPVDSLPGLTRARERFFADDWAGTWAALEPVIDAQPSDGEVALLRSLALAKLAEPLPTLGTRLLAFVEARRALDLDPDLGRATRQVSETGMALHRAAPTDVRAVLAPIVAACCEAVVTLRQESASTLVFLAHHYEDTDRGALALRTARKAVAVWPEDPEVLLALARTETAHGDPARGRLALAAALLRLGGALPPWARGWFE
jgi:hypothetical protein